MSLHSKLKIVTTSWDDGDARDVRIAELLAARGMRGTFYCPVKPFNGNPALTTAQQREMISEGFEIGAHTINHEILSEVPAQQLDYIVRTCKTMLEDSLGQRIGMFCYPRGRYTTDVVTALKKANYDGARTVRLLATDTNYGLYDLPTSIQVYPHTRTEYLRNIVRSGKANRLIDYVTRLGMDDDWVAIGKKLFDRVLEQGGVWHMWGHSWEIDELGQWEPLREMLDYVSKRPDVLYLNNGSMVRYLKQHSAN
ncbi:MAG TPA: polysaccharide deacetylase family protein [Terriglobales bacterium]|nr:polysaccharide deacetylase family protein [Terriglobales bacterium]